MADPRVVVALRRREERRAAERFEMEVPVSLPSGHGAVTRDMSASGLAFTSRRAYAVGETLMLTVDYQLDGDSFPLRCEATVVRCEPSPGTGFLVGARLHAALLG